MANVNRNKLKTYAPEARRDFIQAMTDRAAFFGLTAKKVEPVVVRGDVAVIAGRDHPRAVADKRKKLEVRIARDGFAQTMEAMAYTWFNRLVAIRFMELHGYLDHGYRVLSHPDGKLTPEILEHAEHVELPGLRKDRAIDLKLEGNKESELYRLMLTAQCNALHRAMPFLFERINDETELLLPANLLHSDSLVRKLVDGIDEEDWAEVEIIGWLYQFYISEKKDEVIGKVVASADIPAATQLFTPNWIVKYLVQNTLGRQWLATYPNSPLRAQMEFYIEPTEQPSEITDQLKAITPTSLDPEELTMLDPACGSCHILVEGYDLFKAIYLERGYRRKDIPALILQKNLFGLEIDDRAAQLGAFAMMMKARADDRRIFDGDIKPNILALQESNGLDAAAVFNGLNLDGRNNNSREYLFDEIDEEETPLLTRKVQEAHRDFSKGDVASLLALFQDAKTFGSLIRIPSILEAKLRSFEEALEKSLKLRDLVNISAEVIIPLLRQARNLTRKYDVVVANPPYMGSKFFNSQLKAFITEHYNDAKADTCTAFIDRAFELTKQSGAVGLITMQNWMFLSSFREFRENLLEAHTLTTMAHLGANAFPSIGGQVVQVTAFTAYSRSLPAFRGSYRRLVAGDSDAKAQHFTSTTNYTPSGEDFSLIPGSPLAYWISPRLRDTFRFPKVADLTFGEGKNVTSDNARFVRLWWEVACDEIGRDKKWLPYAKGGAFRRWAGNMEHVVDWSQSARDYYRSNPVARIIDRDLWFKPGITWTDIGGGFTGFRYLAPNATFDASGLTIFLKDERHIPSLLGLLNSNVVAAVLPILNPTLHVQLIDVKAVPVEIERLGSDSVVNECISLSANDWNSFERSMEFEAPPVVQKRSATLRVSQELADSRSVTSFNRIKQLEWENNRIAIESYSLSGEFTPEVSDAQITIYRPNPTEDARRLISYAVGCIMGRYSLDEPGLIYAGGGSKGFDAAKYVTFQADDDAIIPVFDIDWGVQKDLTNRVVEFLSIAWPRQHLEENVQFVADSLVPLGGEQSRDTIRRYLAGGFFKHHLSTYKKRPIYWLFSSGREHAFQCLVYIHRYNESTLARMRTKYIIPLQGQMSARIDQLENDKLKAANTSNRKKLQKQQDDLKKQQAELLIFEEKLKHFSDQRISLDLDDGVKVNYGKFGDLLAEVNAITGGKDDE